MLTGAKRLAVALALGLALSGCAANYVPIDSGFAATVIRPGPMKLSVETTTQNNGRVYGVMPVVGVGYIGTTGKSPPHLLFNEVDQKTYGDAFAKELEKLGLSPNAPAESGQPTADIRVKFVSTAHNQYHQQYVLEASMKIQGGTRPFEKTYKIDSNDGVSLGKKLNTNAIQGKQRGAQRLMKAMLADVQDWLRINVTMQAAAQQAVSRSN